jgi:hypothetical protein
MTELLVYNRRLEVRRYVSMLMKNISRMAFGRVFLAGIVTVVALSLVAACEAAVTGFPKNLAGFNAAAGDPPVAIDFDEIVSGTDITGTTISGVTFVGPGAALIVVRGADTFTPGGFGGVLDPNTNKLFPTSGENVLSPGGVTLGPGSNPAVEDDDLTLEFAEPVSAFGFDHLSQSSDGYGFTSIQVFDPSNVLLFSGMVPISNIDGMGGGAAGGADFWGIVSDTANIKRIVIDEGDGNSTYPDCNIGFDTFRYFPAVEPKGNISGLVTLQGNTDHSSQITFELRQPGTTVITVDGTNDEDSLVTGTQITTGSDGSYTIQDVPEGTYDVTAKGSKWLRQKQADVAVTPGGSTAVDFLSLKGGDANNSNSVNVLDLNILKGSYGKSQGTPGYDDRADFNKTNSVNVLDLNILKSNYGKSGAP